MKQEAILKIFNLLKTHKLDNLLNEPEYNHNILLLSYLMFFSFVFPPKFSSHLGKRKFRSL